MKSKNPDFKLVTFLPPAGKEVRMRESINTGKVAAISAQSDKKEIALRWFDFWFGETGSRLINYGFEGKQYDMVDGFRPLRTVCLRAIQPYWHSFIR